MTNHKQACSEQIHREKEGAIVGKRQKTLARLLLSAAEFSLDFIVLLFQCLTLAFFFYSTTVITVTAHGFILYVLCVCAFGRRVEAFQYCVLRVGKSSKLITIHKCLITSI